MKKILFLLVFSFFSNNFHAQELKYRSVDYYFKIVENLEIKELKLQGVLDSNLNIAMKYKEKGQQSLNDKGRAKYFEIKTKVLKSVFKDYLYQQHLEYRNETYVLYFSMAGFDDTEWSIVKWKKGKWKNQEKIDKKVIDDLQMKSDHKNYAKNSDFDFICFNYDEGPKNLDSAKIFIKNDYLVMVRAGLYHSLIDLKSDKVLMNEESPMSGCNCNTKEEMNGWIKKNLHDKINKIINE